MEDRVAIATAVLTEMVRSPGSPKGKVQAAVQYADDLLDELQKPRRGDRNMTHEADDSDRSARWQNHPRVRQQNK